MQNFVPAGKSVLHLRQVIESFVPQLGQNFKVASLIGFLHFGHLLPFSKPFLTLLVIVLEIAEPALYSKSLFTFPKISITATFVFQTHKYVYVQKLHKKF